MNTEPPTFALRRIHQAFREAKNDRQWCCYAAVAGGRVCARLMTLTESDRSLLFNPDAPPCLFRGLNQVFLYLLVVRVC